MTFVNCAIHVAIMVFGSRFKNHPKVLILKIYSAQGAILIVSFKKLTWR